MRRSADGGERREQRPGNEVPLAQTTGWVPLLQVDRELAERLSPATLAAAEPMAPAPTQGLHPPAGDPPPAARAPAARARPSARARPRRRRPPPPGGAAPPPPPPPPRHRRLPRPAGP